MKVKKCKNFTIKSVGIKKISVYDLEVKNNHTFLANNILVHNTDSVYVTLNSFVNKLKKLKPEITTNQIVKGIDNFSNLKLEPFINDCYDELGDYVNARKQAMHMSREVIAKRGIWRKKKNYALDVYNSEGVSHKTGKLKIMGLEAVRSSTPEPCRDAIKKCLEIMLRDDEKTLQDFVKNFKKEFYEYPAHKIASVSGISDIDKWNIGNSNEFKKGTPIHVKASITYNKLLKQLNIESNYDIIVNGSKIKYIYLKPENPTFNNYIAFPDVLPVEFKLDSYIDYTTQFNKTFKHPLESLTSIVGWNIEKKNTLF